MTIKLLKPPLLETNLQLNRLATMRPLKLRPLPRRKMRLLNHIRRASLNGRSQRIPRGNSSQHNRREDLHCSNCGSCLKNRCRQQRAHPVPPSKPCQLFKLLRSSAQTRVIQLHGTLATLGQGAPSGRTIVKRIVHACRSPYRRNSLDWIAIACGTSRLDNLFIATSSALPRWRKQQSACPSRVVIRWWCVITQIAMFTKAGVKLA